MAGTTQRGDKDRDQKTGGARGGNGRQGDQPKTGGGKGTASATGGTTPTGGDQNAMPGDRMAE